MYLNGNLVKQIAIPRVHRHHPIRWGPNNTKGRGRENLPHLCLTAGRDVSLLLPLRGEWHHQPPVRLNYTTGLTGSPAGRRQGWGPHSPHNHVSQFRTVRTSKAKSVYFLLAISYQVYRYIIDVYAHALGVLFLWRTPIHKPSALVVLSNFSYFCICKSFPWTSVLY